MYNSFVRADFPRENREWKLGARIPAPIVCARYFPHNWMIYKSEINSTVSQNMKIVNFICIFPLNKLTFSIGFFIFLLFLEVKYTKKNVLFKHFNFSILTRIRLKRANNLQIAHYVFYITIFMLKYTQIAQLLQRSCRLVYQYDIKRLY